ncbi:alpha/beta hydrolase [Bradyrhizobium sp. Arg68]|uniref:alpha/beta fold hydrolase n=1 Tax=Bradyrhizobium ivorense TaxID=2511166 RepID=UPI001E51E048|nr:alpha/beta hydrolase [Bradyrhizobium ivorense]MCC8937080.1 alpha/beta hydrolase [Bradyrhizobium ivorense]
MSTMSNGLIKTQHRTIDGLSIRYAESEPRQNQALLLSPWPESIYCYEPTWSRLAEHMHLVAVDLPGFGQSEGRDSLMSPKAMGEFIIRIADAFDLKQPHVLGPDIGTSASLFAAALAPGRFRTLVIGTGGAAVPLQLDGVLKEWVEAPSIEPYRRIDGRDVVSAVISTFERYKPTEAAREDYLASFAGERFAESMRYVRTYPEQLPLLSDLLPRIETPVLVINGARDPVVPPVNAEYLHDRLPKSKLELIDAGHFIWEDAADIYATLVTDWWGGGYTKAGPRQPR